jgi:hypothetical protein
MLSMIASGAAKGAEIVRRKHPEWAEHHLRWRWLADSLEGGDRYRWQTYGTDARGLPARNLVRHKREYPDPDDRAGYADAAMLGAGVATPTDDDYSLRLVRTPVPDFVSEAVRKHLGRIYSHEVQREGPDAYTAWCRDVDGSGLPVDRWMQEEVAPLLLAVGQLDVVIDHPPAPAGAVIRSKADHDALGLGRVVAKVVMPWDVVWWRLGPDKRYEEVLIAEPTEKEDGGLETLYRHWTRTDWALYSPGGEVRSKGEHSAGIVPVVRLFVARKHRCRHVGWTPLEAVAERQRESYNRESELILSDVLQAHPMLQGPEDAIAGGTMSLGPGWMLPKKKSNAGGDTSYEGFEFLDPPKGASDSLRTNLDRLRDDSDRSQGLVKPAGGESPGMVGQSGVSKSYDHATYNDLLTTFAAAFEWGEIALGRAIVAVATGGKPPAEEVSVVYSRRFALRGGEEILGFVASLQEVVANAGRTPTVERIGLFDATKEMILAGQKDSVLRAAEAEFKAAVEAASAERAAGIRQFDPGGDDDPEEDEIEEEEEGEPDRAA